MATIAVAHRRARITFALLRDGMVDDEWVEATRSFPSFLASERERTRKELAGCSDEVPCLETHAIRFLALSLLLGDWVRVKETLDVPPSTCAWLEAARPEMLKELAQDFGMK